MFSLAKFAIHRHRLDESLKDIRWTCYDPSPPLGLRLNVESGFVRIANGNDELFHRRLGKPNHTVLKGAFGDALLLRVNIPAEDLSVRLKFQFESNSFVDGKGVRVNFMQMLERLEMINDSTDSPANPVLPEVTQAAIQAFSARGIQDQRGSGSAQSSQSLFDDVSSQTRRSSSELWRSSSADSIRTSEKRCQSPAAQSMDKSVTPGDRDARCQQSQTTSKKKGGPPPKKTTKMTKRASCCPSSQQDLFSDSQSSQLQTHCNSQFHGSSQCQAHFQDKWNTHSGSQKRCEINPGPSACCSQSRDDAKIGDVKHMNSIRESLQELKEGQTTMGASKRFLMEQEKRKILMEELAEQRVNRQRHEPIHQRHFDATVPSFLSSQRVVTVPAYQNSQHEPSASQLHSQSQAQLPSQLQSQLTSQPFPPQMSQLQLSTGEANAVYVGSLSRHSSENHLEPIQSLKRFPQIDERSLVSYRPPVRAIDVDARAYQGVSDEQKLVPLQTGQLQQEKQRGPSDADEVANVLPSTNLLREQLAAIKARLSERETSTASTPPVTRDDRSRPSSVARRSCPSPLARRSTFPSQSPVIERRVKVTNRGLSDVSGLQHPGEESSVVALPSKIRQEAPMRNRLHEQALLRKSQTLNERFDALSPATRESTSAVLSKSHRVIDRPTITMKRSASAGDDRHSRSWASSGKRSSSASGREDPTSASFKDCELSSAAEIAGRPRSSSDCMSDSYESHSRPSTKRSKWIGLSSSLKRSSSDDSRYRSKVSKSVEWSGLLGDGSSSPASNSSISLVFASTPKDVQRNVRRWLTHAAAEGTPKTSESRKKILTNYETPAYAGPKLKGESLKSLLKDPLKRDSQYYAKDSPGTRRLLKRNSAGRLAETIVVGGAKRKMPAEVMNEDEEKWVDVNPKWRVSDRKQMVVKRKRRDGDHEFKGADQRPSQASSKVQSSVESAITPSLFSDDEDLINLLTDYEDEGNLVEIDSSSRKGSWREVDKKKKKLEEEVGSWNSIHNAGDFSEESRRESVRGNIEVSAGFARLDAGQEKSKNAPEEDSLEDLGEVEILKDWQNRKVVDHGEAKAQRTDRDKHQEVLSWILNDSELREAVKKICNQEE